MKYLTITMGALLALGGGVSIWQGMDIVQVERGWTAVISGATALTGGIVTIAIGLLIGTVESLRNGLATQFTANHPYTDHAATHLGKPAQEPAEEPAQEPGTRASMPPIPESQELPPLSANEEALHRPKPAMPEFVALDFAPATVAPVDPITPLRGIDDFWTRDQNRGIHGHVGAPAVANSQPPEPVVTSPDLEPDVARLNLPEKQKAPEVLAKGADPHQWLENALADAGDDDPAFDWLRNNKRKPVKAEELQTSRSGGVESTDFGRAEASMPEVVRHYEFGGVKYTLHADGSIEAHSPEGRFHFGNMNELREHLAHRA